MTFDPCSVSSQTLHSVCRIAEVVIALQQAGSVQYTSWTLEFHCAEDMFEKLKNIAKEMEDQLGGWKSDVRQAREQFYELNYYTTVQLLSLRKELGRLKSQTSTPISPNVLTLLQSISADITATDVRDAVHGVLSEKQEGQPPPAVGAQPIPSATRPLAAESESEVPPWNVADQQERLVLKC